MHPEKVMPHVQRACRCAPRVRLKRAVMRVSKFQLLPMTDSSKNGQPPHAERRARPRLYVQGRARVLLPPARAFDAEMVDISEGGVCLTSPVELAPGTWCHLRIEIPATAAQLSVSGHVCFCIEQHGSYRVGVHCTASDGLLAAVHDRGSGQSSE
jgi:hypothetical protein